MYPEVRAAIAADTSPDLRAPGFDIAAHREQVRLANLALPREEVAAVEDLDVDGLDVVVLGSGATAVTLVPALAARLQAGPPPPSYPALIDAALAVLAAWPAADKAAFVAGHPRIGEVRGLSALSAREQAARATPPAPPAAGTRG